MKGEEEPTKKKCTQIEDLDQPRYLSSLIGVFPQGEGGTLIFSYIRRLKSFFVVQNFEFQYFWGVSEK